MTPGALTTQQKSSPALASVPALKRSLTGISKPIVHAKKNRRSQCMTRLTCLFQVSWTTWSEQKQKPARKAPNSSELPEYAHAGINVTAC